MVLHRNINSFRYSTSHVAFHHLHLGTIIARLPHLAFSPGPPQLSSNLFNSFASASASFNRHNGSHREITSQYVPRLPEKPINPHITTTWPCNPERQLTSMQNLNSTASNSAMLAASTAVHSLRVPNTWMANTFTPTVRVHQPAPSPNTPRAAGAPQVGAAKPRASDEHELSTGLQSCLSDPLD